MKSPGNEHKQEKERATEGAPRIAETQARGDRNDPTRRRRTILVMERFQEDRQALQIIVNHWQGTTHRSWAPQQ